MGECNKTDTNINMCACMGRQGDDPFCPCVMRQRGLEPTDPWTPEKIAELREAFRKMFEWKDIQNDT